MALKQSAPRASLVPDNASGGSRVPDGEYTIESCRTGMNTYNGTVPEGVPAIIVVYHDGASSYEQAYKAGDNDHLVPTEDNKGFAHPNGKSTPTILKGGAANCWLRSLDVAGFEVTDSDAGVAQFEGLRVRIASKMLKLGREAKETPTPLVEKILGQAGKNVPAKPVSRSSNSDGDLDAAAVALVLDALKKAPGKTLPLAKLGMNVWMAAGNHADYKDHRQDIKKLITVDWLQAHDDKFMTDGEEATLK